MQKMPIIGLVLLFLCFCSPNTDKVAKRLEDGVPVIVNHIKPYKRKGQPVKLVLERELTIDLSKDEFANHGISEVNSYDIDSEGNIYFLQQASSMEHIIRLDKNGNSLTSFGRNGQGPGELQWPTGLKIDSADRILVTDPQKGTLLIFDARARLLNELHINLNFRQIEPLENGRYLVYKQSPEKEKPQTQVVLLLSDHELREIKELERMNIRVSSLQDEKIDVSLYLFVWDTGKDKIFTYNETRDYEIDVYDFDGRLLRKITKEFTKINFLEDFKNDFLKRIPEDNQLRKKFSFPEYMPPFQTFFADENGRLFVITWEKTQSPGEYICDIFNPEGILIGRQGLTVPGISWSEGTWKGAKIKNNLLYCLKENESGYKELTVHKMMWQ